MRYRVMILTDYNQLISLWKNTDGIQLRDADSEQGIAQYLNRNPNLSHVCEIDGDIVGTIMAGHDGKRGYIQHLAVNKNFRDQGIGSKLVARCIESLKSEGIFKSHIHVLHKNASGQAFWRKMGWHERTDLAVYSFVNSVDANV